MFEHAAPRPWRVIAVAAIALMTAGVGLPALAATSPDAAKNLSLSEDWTNPHMATLADSSSQLLLQRIRSAQDMISAGKLAAARNDLDAAKDTAGAIRTMLPFVAIADQIKEAKTVLLDGRLEQFRQDLLPVYARLDEMSDFAPNLAADTKVNLKRAEFMADHGRIVGAAKAIDDISCSITASNVYIPAVYVYDRLAAAQSALSEARPNVGAAKHAVADAENVLLPS